MWSSLVVGKAEEGDHQLMMAKILAAHPLINGDLTKAEQLVHTSLKPEQFPTVTKLNFSPTGEGWFEANTGRSAEDFVKELKRHRRVQKDVKMDLDSLVHMIRVLKSKEVQDTLDGIGWASGRHDTLRNLGLSDRNLKSLRLFHESRADAMQKACEIWEESDRAIQMLEKYQDVWGEGEQSAWVAAMEMRKDARKMWRNALHQSDSLSKEQKNWMEQARAQLLQKGPLTARNMLQNINEHSEYNTMKSEDASYQVKGRPRISPSRLSALLKMYGEEYNITKGYRKGEYVLIESDGLVLKDMWGYAGGFLDADGSIYITDRNEPRASFIATGNRGRVHCETLHKELGCGVLQLDQKVYKDGQRSQHRLSFYSKEDLRKLLTGLLPHLYMKDMQAKAVLAFIDEGDSARKGELRKLVQYLNWDGTAKGEKCLRDWGTDRDTVMSWAEGL